MAQAQEAPKWGASIDFEGKLGSKRSLGEADLMVPFWQDNDTLLFGNARYRFDDEQSKEGNFGVGVRHMLTSGWNLGAYGYFDRRETGYDNDFNQLTFGAEALGRHFDLRANTYWPVGETVKNVDALNTATLSGTSVIFRGGEERALQGFDAEVGWRVPVFEFESPYDFRLYGGGFHFYDTDDAAPDITGPRFRAELTAYEIPNLPNGTRVTLGAEWQNDDVRGSQGFGSLRLRIPLQSEAQRNRRLTAQEHRMTTPVVRDVDIVAQAGDYGTPETATQLADGTTFSVISSNSTTGAHLPTAVQNAGDGSTVLLSGTFNTVGETILREGQTLIGANFATVRSPSGRIAPLSAAAGVINGSFGAVPPGGVVTLANNTTLTGLTITNNTNTVNFVVGGRHVTGVTLTDNVISGTTTSGTIIALYVDGTSSITATGNTFSASGPGVVHALRFSGGGVIATLQENRFSAQNGTTNNAVSLGNTTINAGSTGNVLVAGECENTGGVTGSISFTNGSTCP